MCLSPCNGCMQLLGPKLVEQAIEDLFLLCNCAPVCLENICLKQNKGLISPNFFPSTRIIIASSSALVLRPLKTFSVGFRSLTAQTSYLKAGYSYLARTGVTRLRNQSRFDTEYREYINTLPSQQLEVKMDNLGHSRWCCMVWEHLRRTLNIRIYMISRSLKSYYN